MRRPPALFLTLVIATSTLFAGVSSGASAFSPVGIAHPGGDDGNFSTIPATYGVGEKIELYANFASDQAGRTVTYYTETSPGSNDYTSVGTDAANSNGNAYLKGYTVNATQKVFALSSSGDVTEVHTLTPGPVEHPGGDDGNLSTIPDAFDVGDAIELYANFASDQSGMVVTYYRETSAGSGEYAKVGSDDANTNGNAYLKNYTVDETQKVFARTSAGKVTEVHTLTPHVPGPVAPDGTVTGTLAATPAAFGDGDTIQLGANFPTGTFPVEFYGEGPADVWTELATVQSHSNGNAYYKTYEVDGVQRVFARKSSNDRTEVFTVTPSAKPTLSIQRHCSGNSCTGTATASGVLDPVAAGVPVTLQRLDGSTWRTVTASNGPVTTDAEGKIAYQFSLSGVPQWTTRTYRFLVNGIASNQIHFMPGPTQLGKNVLRVDVEDGIYPTQKGPEYPGVATLSTNGTEFLDHVELEDFGVRGSTTATYTKKPYKLKFDKSPKDTGVFGMPADKSWTLLAMWKDQAFVREKVGLDLGIEMDHMYWTPDSRFVELFVNDQYRGAYLMTESVKIDGDRVNVDAEHGVIMETDEPSVEDPQLGFESTIGNIVFAFKDPDERDESDPEKVTQSKLDAIKNRINDFESKLYSSSTRNQYPDFIDVDSAIDFFLVKEFTKDHDSDFDRSHYFSWDPIVPEGADEDPGPMEDNTFHFGPVWDFDHSAGNDTDNDTFGAYLRSPAGWMLRGEGPTRSSHWFVELFKSPGFEDAVRQRWSEVRGIFADVSQQDVNTYVAELGVGASNDRSRWADEPKRFKPHGSGLAGERAYVRNWYEDRFAWMDEELS